MAIEPRLEDQRLTKLLGGTSHREFSNALSRKVRIWKDRLSDLIEPHLYYRTLKVNSEAKGLVLPDEGIEFQSRRLSLALRSSQETVCFIGTIGSGIERETSRLVNSNSLSEAYLLDAMGSVSVEGMIDDFQKLVDTHYGEEGKTVTLRFSPGYCDWPITEQKKLFSIFDPNEISVELLDSCLMKPRKSISGIFGISPQGSTPYNPCLDCKISSCDAKRS